MNNRATKARRRPVALHLDVSEHFTDRAEAIEGGKAREQISIWDVEKHEEIKTGGTGRLG